MAVTNVLTGKRYIWSGDDFAWNAANKAKYVRKGTGDTIIVDALEQTVGSETSNPIDAASKWIVSDDLWVIGAHTASLRIKAIKTAEASYTAGSHTLNAIGFLDEAEMSLSPELPAAFLNAYPLRIGGVAAPTAGRANYLNVSTAIAETHHRYQHFHFYKNDVERTLSLPYRFIGCYLRLLAHATNDPADPVVHTWQFEAQWYYLCDSKAA